MRPTERPTGVQTLRDHDAPDFLEAHRLALLAFLDLEDPRCAALRQRLDVVAAKGETAGPPMDPAAARAAEAAGGSGPTAGRAFFGAGVVDVSRHRLVAEALGVKSVPTVLLFVDGAVVDRLMGNPPEALLDEMVQAATRRLAG